MRVAYILGVCAILLTGPVAALGSAQHLAIVIDCSTQNKRVFERTIRQAVCAIERLTEKDALSIVVFDDAAELLLPVTSADNKAPILEKLKGLRPKGKRALFAGIAKGAEEVRRNASGERAKRVMLLSGNGTGTLIGPGAPEEIRTLTESFGKEKITLFSPPDDHGQGRRRGRHPRRQGGKKDKGSSARHTE